jgi:hypothetical protein
VWGGDTQVGRIEANLLGTGADDAIRAGAGLDICNLSFERAFSTTWGTDANEKCDVFFSTASIYANFDVTLSSTWLSAANASGQIRVLYSFGGDAVGNVTLNNMKILAGDPAILAHFALMPIRWDAVNKRWTITVAHTVTDTELLGTAISIKAFAPYPAYVDQIRQQMGITPVYHDDTTVPAPNTDTIALGATDQIVWAGDTNLYRGGPNQLKTDDALTVVGALTAQASATVSGGVNLPTGGMTITASGTTGAVTWAGDTNIYRSGANALATDDALAVAGNLSTAGTLTATGTLTAAGGTVVTSNAAGGTVTIGGDTNLYHAGTDLLATDDTFRTPTIQLGDSGNTMEKGFQQAFTAVANQRIDLYWTGSFSADIEVTISGTFTSGNAGGSIKAVYSLNGTAAGAINVNTMRVLNASPGITDHFALMPIYWDATNSRWALPIAHLQATANSIGVGIKFVGAQNSYINGMRTSFGVSAIYTSASPVPVRNDWDPGIITGKLVGYFSANATQNLTTSGTYYPIVHQTTGRDTFSGMQANRSSFIPKVAGWYDCSGQVAFNANATGLRQVGLSLNGSVGTGGLVYMTPPANYFTIVCPSTPIQCNGTTDYIDLQAWQTSGGTLATISTGAATSMMRIVYLGT